MCLYLPGYIVRPQITGKDSFEVAFNAACALVEAGSLAEAERQLQLAQRIGARAGRGGAGRGGAGRGGAGRGSRQQEVKGLSCPCPPRSFGHRLLHPGEKRGMPARRSAATLSVRSGVLVHGAGRAASTT